MRSSLVIHNFLRMLHRTYIVDLTKVLTGTTYIPVYEMSAESWINEVRGELAHAGSVIGPGSPVADNLRLSPSTQSHCRHSGSCLYLDSLQ